MRFSQIGKYTIYDGHVVWKLHNMQYIRGLRLETSVILGYTNKRRRAGSDTIRVLGRPPDLPVHVGGRPAHELRLLLLVGCRPFAFLASDVRYLRRSYWLRLRWRESEIEFGCNVIICRSLLFKVSRF